MPPEPPDYFAATEAWLLAQPRRATAGGVRKRRPVAPDLARHTANRIRRATPASPGWQPPRWWARHKLTGRIRSVRPAFHNDGIAGLIKPDERLLLAHTHGDRLRLRATLAYLNSYVEPSLSASCYGGRPDANRRGTDRRAALVRFRALVRDGGLPWAAKLDIANFFDAIPHGPLLAALRHQVPSRRCEREVACYLAWYWRARWPDWPDATPLPGEPLGVPQGSPISGVLANVYLSAIDQALERAGIVFLRYLDDVTILAPSPAALAAGLGTAMELLESLGMSLRAEKTQAAWLGGGEPPVSRLDLPGRGHELPVAGDLDFLGIQFLGPELFRARETTVNRLLRRARTAIVMGRGKRPAMQRYFRACRRINELFGYELTGRPARCRIGKVRYVQPRQHAVLGHSELILEQMRRVDRTVRRWLRDEFGPAIACRATGRSRRRALGAWRVRSAARMYEMETLSRNNAVELYGAHLDASSVAFRPLRRRVNVDRASCSMPLALVVSGANLASAKVATQAGNGAGGCARHPA